MVSHVVERKAEAIAASRMLVDLYRDRRSWSEVKPYVDCLFELSDAAKPSSPGDQYRKAAKND